MEVESEPEDGEILDELEEEEEEEKVTSAPHGSRGRRGGSRSRRRGTGNYAPRHDTRRRHGQDHEFSRHRNLPRYNNMSERSGGISRTLEYVKYLRSFTERNKSISARRSSVPERRMPRNRHSRSRSPSPVRDHRKDRRRSRHEKEIKHNVDSGEKAKLKSHSTGSTSSREGTIHVEDAVDENVIGDIEEISADEMQDNNQSSPASSIQIVDKISPGKAPEIITLDSTDTSEDDNTNTFADTEEVDHQTADGAFVTSNNINLGDDDSEITDFDASFEENLPLEVIVINTVGRTEEAGINDEEIISENPSDEQTLGVNENADEVEVAGGNSVQEDLVDANNDAAVVPEPDGNSNVDKLPDGRAADEVPEGNIVVVEVADGNVTDEVPDASIVVVDVADGNVNEVLEVEASNVTEEVHEASIADEQELAENITEKEQGDLGDRSNFDLEEEDVEQSHLSDEEIDVLELRNKLLADLVNKTDSSTSSYPITAHLSPEIALRDLNGEKLKILENFESGGNNEEEEEALRAVVLSLMNKKKVEPVEATRNNSTAIDKPAKSENPRPKPISKRRSTNDENRSYTNRRRSSNTSANPSNKSNRRSPPRRRPLPASRRSSIGSRRTSREYDRRRSRERDRISPDRDREEYGHDRKTSRAATVSPPPSSTNRSKESASSSVSVKKTTLPTSTSCAKENNSSIVNNIRDLPENDLRKQLLRNASLQKKASIGLTSPNSDPIVPPENTNLFLHDTDERVTRNEVGEMTIRRTVKFTNNGNENIITTATPSRTFTPPVGIASMNPVIPPLFPHVQRMDVPEFFDLRPPPPQNGLQFTGAPYRYAFGQQPFQQILYTGAPFEHYRPPGPHPHMLPIIQHRHIQPNGLLPLTVSNTCLSLNENLQNNVVHRTVQTGGVKKGGGNTGNQKKRTRGSRGKGNKGKGVVKPSRWNEHPNSANTKELEKTMSKASLGPQEKSSASPLQVKHSPDLIKAATVSTSVTIGSHSPLDKSTTATPSNATLSLDNVAKEPMQRLLKSSPYASPVLSPAVATNATLPKTGSTKKHFPPPRLIIPVNDDDSTSEDDEGKTNNSKGDSSIIGGNAQQLGNDNNFQKSLLEFLKRAREESEKQKEQLSAPTSVNEKSESKSKDIAETDYVPISSTIETTSSPSPSSSALLVKKKEAASTLSDKVNNIVNLPEQKSTEKPSVDSAVPNLSPSDGALKGSKELSNSAPAKTPNSTSDALIGPSPMKKRRLLKAVTNSTQQLAEHGSTEATELSTSLLTSLTPAETESSPTATATSAKVCERVIQKEDKRADQSEQSSSQQVPTSVPGSARTAVLIPKRMLRISPKPSALLTSKEQTSSNQPNGTVSSTKKTATSSSGAGSLIPVTKTGPSQPSPPASKQIIDDLTRKIKESRDQLALSSKEKELFTKERELLHCRQSFSNGLRDIHKSLLQHTRLVAADSKLQSEITSVEKRLQELKKRQVDFRTKATTVNMSIKEKSKSVLPTKASCISLERHVKNLGDSVMGVKNYKVTDLFTRDIETVVKDITALHSRQPANHRSERGVMFHQVISGDIDPTSTLANKGSIMVRGNQNNPPSLKAPALVVAPPATNPEKRPEAKTKPQPLQNVLSGSSSGGTGGKETVVSNRPAKQQNTTQGQNIIPEKISGKEEMRFLTRHGRKSLEEKEESLNEKGGESESNSFAGGDVLTEAKSFRVVLADLEIPLSGSFTNAVDPYIQLCPESLLNNVCLKPGCEFQHI